MGEAAVASPISYYMRYSNLKTAVTQIFSTPIVTFSPLISHSLAFATSDP